MKRNPDAVLAYKVGEEVVCPKCISLCLEEKYEVEEDTDNFVFGADVVKSDHPLQCERCMTPIMY